MEQEILNINGVEYVRIDCTKPEIKLVEGKSVALQGIGEKVIVRSSNEGINVGIVIAADETGVILKNCRRLWKFYPKNKELSWYEGVAVSGITSGSIVSGTVFQKIIIEDYSLTICTDEAFKIIMEITPNAQK